MSDFRADGKAALEWVARYLEGVGEQPVLAQVEPGEIRAALPSSPPERGEPFAAVLRDRKNDERDVAFENAPDLLKNRVVMWQHRWHKC